MSITKEMGRIAAGLEDAVDRLKPRCTTDMSTAPFRHVERNIIPLVNGGGE